MLLVFSQGHHYTKEFIVSQTPLSSTVADFWRMIWEHNAQIVVRLPDSNSQVYNTHILYVELIDTYTYRYIYIKLHTHKHVSCLSQREEECCAYWPSKEQPLSIDGFTVSYSREEHMCLSNDERLLVQEFTVQSPQVTRNKRECLTLIKMF